MFKHSDIDNDGFMTESEVRSASIWAPQQVHQKFVQHDADGNGKLTCQEMVNMVLDHGKIEFDQLDRDGNGFVTAVEILHSYPSVTKALVKAEIYKFDADGDDQLSFDEGVDTIDHVLDELLLRSTKSSSVRDIEDSIISLGVLSVNTSDLYEVLVSDFVELLLVVHELG